MYVYVLRLLKILSRKLKKLKSKNIIINSKNQYDWHNKFQLEENKYTCTHTDRYFINNNKIIDKQNEKFANELR